jgi:hypothetical protein
MEGFLFIRIFIIMGKKFKIRLTEQDFTNLIVKGLLDAISGSKSETPKIDLSNKDSKSEKPGDLKSSGEFTPLDLNTTEGYNAYKQIADKFISSRSSNLLGINGSMIADAAKKAFNNYGKYVPVELAMGQLAQEGGFSKNPNARPIKTKNPFNVGNVDSGSNVFHNSVQSGIQRYYDLIAKNYLSGNKTASDLLSNFVNKNGNRYASGRDYELSVGKIADQVKNMGQPVYASLSKKIGSDIA